MSIALIVPGGLLLIAAGFDVRRREIPDVFPVLMLLWAVVSAALGWLPLAWWQVVAGIGVGLAFGALFFRLGGLGGGDAKLLSGLGANLGPLAFLVALVFIVIVGGALGVVSRLRRQREFAYAPAIAVGYALFLTTAGVAHVWT